MQLAKSITPKKINALYCFIDGVPLRFFGLLALLFFVLNPAISQDNSPYSRYGLGDIVPPTNILNRGMGGVSAAYNDFLSINFSNPASYGFFQSVKEPKNKKQALGRAILDVGINIENRTLREPATTATKFVAKNALFSYMHVGMSLKKNWGLMFGLRPLTRISYKMVRRELLTDPSTGLSIDSATTLFEGTGGSFLPTLGTGFALFEKMRKNGPEKLTVGVNMSYMFGTKDYNTKRSISNDSIIYYTGIFESKTSFGKMFFSGGVQYRFPLNKTVSMTLGAYGNWDQNIAASRDAIVGTIIRDPELGDTRLDSVYEQRDLKGKILYPASYTAGFVLEKVPELKSAGWLLALDFAKQNWDDYRFYGEVDSIQNSWQVRVGAQLRPAPKKNYFSNVAYRFGFFAGPDYVKVQDKLPQYGVSFGLGLPLANYRSSFASANQATVINLAFEYIKRGNNDNILKENLFRFSVGFSLSDFWFSKRKYE